MSPGTRGDEPLDLAQEIAAHYAEGDEAPRLGQGRSRLERLRTQELLERHLLAPPAAVLDVGGGPGVHAVWLAERGYQVRLIDPIPLHIEQANEASRRAAHPLAAATLGDARRLPEEPGSADVVLLLGPLYHLTERADRMQALREAWRVLRAGGLLFAVGISRFASLFDGLASAYLADPAFQRIVADDLLSGQHRNPTNEPAYFTTAYFHHPDELRTEVTDAGFQLAELVSLEGPAYWAVQDFDRWWDDPVLREQILDAARAVESEPSLLGLGPHLMAVARKRGNGDERLLTKEGR